MSFKHRALSSSLSFLLASVLVLPACTDPPPDLAGDPGARRAALSRLATERLLPWGVGTGQVGLRAARPERLGDGPSAVAVQPDGAIVVLDRFNRRILRLSDDETQVHASVPEEAEDLAAGPGGALAVYSPLRARVWVLDAAGKQAGQLDVQRALRQVQRISLGASHQLTLHDAFQESYLLGSPAAPQTLEAILHGRREGAFLLPHRGGVGLAVRRLPDGHPELLLLENKPGERSRVLKRQRLEQTALSARLVGVAGDLACLLLERDADPAGATLQIARAAICLDVLTGRRVLELQLPGVGLYLPRRELAVGGDPARLALIHPEPDGLSVKTWPLATGATPGGVR